MIVEHVVGLIVNIRKVLHTYDGYRSFMTLRVLEMFRENVRSKMFTTSAVCYATSVTLHSRARTLQERLKKQVCILRMREHTIVSTCARER